MKNVLGAEHQYCVCSNCGHKEVTDRAPYSGQYIECPNCGCKMPKSRSESGKTK